MKYKQYKKQGIDRGNLEHQEREEGGEGRGGPTDSQRDKQRSRETETDEFSLYRDLDGVQANFNVLLNRLKIHKLHTCKS